MKFVEFLLEENKKKEKIVFVETDPRYPFPNDTISSLRKDINKKCKDLELEWNNGTELVNKAFEELNVPIPQIYLTKRWQQYLDLLKYAVENLYDSRGLKGSWVTTV